MAVCNLGHEHEDPGPEEVIVEDRGEVKAAEAAADSTVEVARIEADRDVQVAKIGARAQDEDQVAELAALRARVDVLQAAVMPPEPEPEPVPVTVPVPEPDPEPDGPPAPPEAEHAAPKGKSGGGWWAGYSAS